VHEQHHVRGDVAAVLLPRHVGVAHGDLQGCNVVVYVYVYVCMFVYRYVCMYVYRYVCMYVYVCVCL